MRSNLFLILVFGILAISLCAAASPVFETANGIVAVDGLSLTLDDGSLDLYLTDLEPTTHNALITLSDGATGAILAKEEIAEGRTITRTIAGNDISITVNKVADSSVSTGTNRWANITLKTLALTRNVNQSSCFIYVVNYPNPGYPTVPPDFYVCPVDIEVGSRDAVIWILTDSSERPDKIKEGGNIVRKINNQSYKITVMQTSLASPNYWSSSNTKLKVERVSSGGTGFDNYSLLLNGGSPTMMANLSGAVTYIRLIDLETETKSAIIEVSDENGSVLALDKVKENQILVRKGVGNYRYQIKVIKTAAGAGMPAVGFEIGSWAKLDIVPNVTAAESPYYNATSIGSVANTGGIYVQLLNLEQDTRKALVNISNSTDTLYYEKIGEGQTIVRNVSGTKYSIKVMQTAAGYSYDLTSNPSAAWAKMVIAPTSAAVSPAPLNATVLNFDTRVLSPDLNVWAYFEGIEPVSHDATFYVQSIPSPRVSVDKVKVGSTVVRKIAGNKYALKLLESAPGYYKNVYLGWAKVTFVNTTAAESVNYSVTTMWPISYPTPISCQNASMLVFLDGVEPISHKAIISLRDFGFTTLFQDKVAVGGTVTYRDPVNGNCTVKVVQTADEPFYIVGVWAKMVVN
ncbi:MAG: hypothetical protein V1492_01340 [Candidatus Micrarchaeota archaeon]